MREGSISPAVEKIISVTEEIDLTIQLQRRRLSAVAPPFQMVHRAERQTGGFALQQVLEVVISDILQVPAPELR
jgi:hypothetical protein